MKLRVTCEHCGTYITIDEDTAMHPPVVSFKQFLKSHVCGEVEQ